MKRLYIVLLTMIFILGVGSSANALMFEGSDAGGIGSAEWNLVDVDGSSWTIWIDNTSPKTLIGDTGVNSPGITGIGFDFTGGGIVSSWSLTALDSTSSSTVIGGTGSLTNDWVLGAGTGDVVLDFNSSTASGSSGALYNPLATAPFGGPPQYFTTAVLTIGFSDAASLVTESAFVRMQNVGLNGDGSLKLNPVPEPATMLLLGSGLLGLVGYGRRKKLFKK